jgi:cytochrome b561
MAIRRTRETYGAVAVVLHWLIAAAILYNVWLGATMDCDEQFDACQQHKSVGITILALSVLRLIWRMVNPPPPLPPHMPAWERLAARATHWAFYLLMIGVPLSGWALVSASPVSDFVTTKVWGLFELPLLPGFPTAANRALLAGQIEELHELFGLYAMLGLLALHVAAALKHHIWDRDVVLTRMIPFLPRRDEQP